MQNVGEAGHCYEGGKNEHRDEKMKQTCSMTGNYWPVTYVKEHKLPFRDMFPLLLSPLMGSPAKAFLELRKFD